MATPPRSGRIGALPTLPIFFRLQGRTVLLAGGSDPAVWKAELLAAAGARVLVCDPDPCPAMVQLVEAWTGAIRLEHRVWRPEDLGDAALAIGALEAEDGAKLQSAARRAGVPVNIVDRPALCDFQFGTIVDRSPLLIAISTDGAAPVFGQALRTRIEALLPPNISDWARAAQTWRPDVQALSLGFAARRRFWEGFAARAFDGSEDPPADADRAAFLTSATTTQAERRGRVQCVGLGPGSTDQLTLGAINAMQSADSFIVGHDTDQTLTSLGRREAERITEPDGSVLAELISNLVQAGQRIAFVGVGDPRRCIRWKSRMSVLDTISPDYTVVEGLSCRTCHPGCAARSVITAPA